MRRIGFTLSLPDATGAPRMVAHFISRLRQSGYGITVFHGPLPKNEASILPELKQLGAESVFEPRLARPISRSLVRDLANQFHARQLCAVVGVQQRDRAIAMQAAARAQVPGFVSCQNTHRFWGTWPVNRLKEAYYAWAMRNFPRLIVCSSPVVLDEIVNRYRVPNDRAVLLPNAIDVRQSFETDAVRREQVRSEFRVSPDEFLLVNVGRINIQKGQDLLIEALSRLPAGIRKWKLVLVGGVSQDAQLERMERYHRELHELVARHDLKDRVLFAGWRTDVPVILGAADGYVQASRWEGFGIASFEGMAAKLPTVWTNCWGRPEGFEDGKHGWLVPTDDIDELQAALALMLQRSAEERREIGIAARQFVVDNYDVQRISHRFQQLIEERLIKT